MRRSIATVATVGLLLSACGADSVTVPATIAERVVGTLGAVEGGYDALRVPANVRAGQPTVLTVITYGNSCVSPAGAHVSQDGLQVVLTPLDYVTVGGGCYEMWASNPRPVVVVFGRPGIATVSVRGRSPFNVGLITIQQSVTVLPM